MKLELHLLQNFAPSNLNRDDTGAPKDCELGGYRRARISSQCLKRAIRESFEAGSLVEDGDRATRTKRIVEAAARELAERHKRPVELGREAVKAALEGAGLGIDAEDDYKTQYLLFIPQRLVRELAAFVERNWNVLSAGAPATEVEGEKKKSGAKKKAEAKSAFPKELANEIRKMLADATKTPELALFGRMIADAPEWNVDAACQVAHALSTNRATMEFDFYTAVDDLRPRDNQGSDMMGTIQFNSSCFYRYAVVDVTALAENLGEPMGSPLVRRTVEAFVRASLLAIPTGKQNGMAAHNLPSYALAIVRDKGVPISLANAFLKPVRPGNDTDLVDASIRALESYYGSVESMYGRGGVAFSGAAADRAIEGEAGASIQRLRSTDDLLKSVERTVFGASA